MKLILIAGQAGVGKTTLAHIVAKKVFDLGYIPQLMSFAGPLKRKAEELGFVKADKPKEYREYCQREGAEKREQDPDYWVNLFEEELASVLEQENKDLKENKDYWERCIIVDDCRYANELALGIKHSGTLIFLSYGLRKMPEGYGEWRDHHSENLAKLIDEGPSKHRGLFDAILKNQGTIEDLQEKIEPMLEIWLSPTDEEEDFRFDEQESDLSKAIEELVNLLIMGKQHLQEEDLDDDDDWDDSDTLFKEGAD